MLLDKDLKIPHFSQIIASNADRLKPMLGMDENDTIIPESVAGQIVENMSKQEYEIHLSFQALLMQINPLTASGSYLDVIASVRGLERKDGETDDELRKRLTGVKSIGDTRYKKYSLLETKLQNVQGVTYARVIYKNGITYPIVSGGSDDDIADVLKEYAPIGELGGNTEISKDCIEYKITRAIQQPLKITLKVNDDNDACICSTSDKNKIIDLIMEKSCDYTAGSLVKDTHFKSMLGLEGFMVSDIEFEISATAQLTLNSTAANVNPDPCADAGTPSELLNKSCINAPCAPIKGSQIIVPEWVIPVFCRNMIEVQ